MASSRSRSRGARRSTEQWRCLIEEQQSSGLTQRVFCSRRQLAVSTFALWKGRLSARDLTDPSAAAFVELTPPPAALATPEGWEVELSLGEGVRLRVRRM